MLPLREQVKVINRSGNRSSPREARLQLIDQAIDEVGAVITVGEEEVARKTDAGQQRILDAVTAQATGLQSKLGAW